MLSEDVDTIVKDPNNEDEQAVAEEEEPLGFRRSTGMPYLSGYNLTNNRQVKISISI